MNKQQKINTARQHLQLAYNSRDGVVKLNKNSTLQHELAKFLLCWEALQTEKTFVSEAIFSNGKRADIFILDDCEAWEVLHSESRAEFEKKDYPVAKRAFDAETIIDKWRYKI